jgi:ferrous iron transport protein B
MLINFEGVKNLKFAIMGELKAHAELPKPSLQLSDFAPELITDIKKDYQLDNDYLAMIYAAQHNKLRFLRKNQHTQIDTLTQKHQFKVAEFQAKETIERFQIIGKRLDEVLTWHTAEDKDNFTNKLDRFALHPIWGYLSFLTLLFVLFQVLFNFAQYPMELIDGGVASLTELVKELLPASKLSDLITDGLLAGIGGVVVFIPQIAFLFCFISLLEESGYMARVMVIMDRIMRKFGLNGRSVVPLISGVACAVPAIMATRSINNWKDRLITIMVTPLMSCSARLPVYTVLIALVVPHQRVLGILNIQGLALMGLYLLGFISALLAAWIMTGFVKTSEKSYFIMELPTYQMPRGSHVLLTVWNSVKAFVFEAGKVIVAVSIILWVLASYGPGDAMLQAEQQVISENPTLAQTELNNKIAAVRLESSYAGHFGKFIEPAIKPMGFDWKIGIALITSFAAREVFVGTMSTIYSLGGNDDDVATVQERMRGEINPETHQPMYTPALALSLLLFYVFAMQCMSTLATTYRETKSWKYPLLQLLYMTVLAYLSAFAVYQLLS